jgi:putative ATP-dependent endonuclease of the OLD family
MRQHQKSSDNEGIMRIEKVRIEGFRLIENEEIMLEQTATVIVGRNNSGKTSLTDVFDRFAGEAGPRFRLEDFSVGIRSKFIAAKALRESGATPDVVLSTLPVIAITLTFAYDVGAVDFGPLSPFIIDLDAACTTAIARVEYVATLATLQLLLDIPPAENGDNETWHYYRCLRETLPKAYSVRVTAIDPTDPMNQRHFEGMAELGALIQCGFVRAQRTLDHAKQGDPDVIGKLLGTLYKTANSPTAAAADKVLAANLKASVDSIEKDIQKSFDEMLKGLLPALEVFGFPGLNDTELRPETSLNVEGLLSDHTKIVYTGSDGIHLPEGYNGLGTRNLIFMLLQLESFHKAYRSKATRPGTHLIFIEEPEAHLHPQMQEVFINQLSAAVEKLSAKYPDEPAWKVQFVVSTHSSHIANAANFEAVRYFLSAPSGANGIRRTKVKDFKKGLSVISPEDRNFLHQYMTLTKCDLYFADKAILVEGTTERVLMPRISQIVDESFAPEAKLSRQYLSTVEVGGAYAHLFYPLLDFLELKTLIITDLDAVKLIETEKKKKRWVKCPRSEGTRTSNAAIKAWFNEGEEEEKKEEPISLEELAAKTEEDKQRGYRRITYQISEEGSVACARSFEDALILANPDKFEWDGDGDPATEAWEIAQGLSKAETALRFAIEEANWVVPRYIREGLTWLSQPPPPPADAPPVEAEVIAPDAMAAV